MSQLHFLEWLDANLPWALLIAILALMLLGWGIYSMFSRSRISSSSLRANSSTSRNDTELFDLETRWNSKRDYSAVYDKKPSAEWFEDERKLCIDFLEKLAKPPKHDAYPAEEKKYLEIVKESDSKPFSVWLWLFVVGLLAAEGLSMAYLVADLLNASGTQQQTNYLAVAILVLIMVLTVGAPKFVAYFQTHQFYAYNLYAEAPNSNLSLEGHGEAISMKDSPSPDQKGNSSDMSLPSALRMRRRAGRLVRGILNAAIQSKKSPTRYHKAVYFFVPYLLIASVGIYLTRDKIIDQLQKEEAEIIRLERDAARQARGDPPANRAQTASTQAGDAQGTSDLSQEAREAKADAQRRGILIFIFLFVGIQIIVFLLSTGRGFCSAKGADCYYKIEDFRKRHGNITEEEYKAIVSDLDREHRMEVTATAQRTLAAWQLGLNTAFSDRSIPKDVEPPVLEQIHKLIGKANDRTFLTFAESKEGRAYLSDPTSKLFSGRSDDPSTHGASQGMASSTNSGYPLGEVRDSAAGKKVAAEGGIVEYIEEGDAAGAPPRCCSFAQLKERVADADVAPTCRVRFKDEEEYLPYSTFVKMEKRFRIV